MRLPARFRPLRPVAELSALVPLVVAACSPDTHTDIYPIRVGQIVFPDSVQVGRSDSLVVLAAVGMTGCSTGEVGIARSGDSLVVSGSFECRSEESVVGPKHQSGARIATPPAQSIEARAVLRLPDLDAGIYRIVAQGWVGQPRLADTLVVGNAPATRHERLTGFGDLLVHGRPACGSLPVAYQCMIDDRSLRQLYLVENPSVVPDLPGEYAINATIAGPANCDSIFAGVLRLRSARGPLH